jgi:hypothetical protein
MVRMSPMAGSTPADAWEAAQKAVHDADAGEIRDALGILDEIRGDERPGLDGWEILSAFREILILELIERRVAFEDITSHLDGDEE